MRFRGLLIAGAAVLATTAIAAQPAAAHGRGIGYAALGDSYSAGVGAGPYDLDATCGRSSRSYAPRLAAEVRATAFTFVACGGATTDQVTASQVPSIPRTTGLVTVTAGGNDVGFSAGFATCLAGTDADCAAVVAAAGTTATTVLPGRLDELFAAVRSRAPRADVVIAGYPQFFQGATTCAAVPLDKAKRDSIDAAVLVVDRVIADRARHHHVRYVDGVRAFAGHSICSADPWLNGLVADGAFHPNAAGYAYGFLPAFARVVGCRP